MGERERATVESSWKRSARSWSPRRRRLTDLDAAIGDGDCGTSLKTGWQLILDRLPSLNNQSMGGILNQVAMAIMSSVGGVSGAIYATAFMRAGKKIGAREHLTLAGGA